MASENWKDLLKAQNDDLERMEALDAGINHNQISEDIDKLLKRPVRTEVKYNHNSVDVAAPVPPVRKNSASAPPPAALEHFEDDDVSLGMAASPTSMRESNSRSNPTSLEKAPETADRLFCLAIILICCLLVI